MACFDEIATTLQQRLSTISSFGKKIKFLLGDKIIHIDGTANPPTLALNNGPADATITVSLEDFDKLINKQLNPMIAFTSGKVRIKGDMMAATALKKIF